MSNDVISSFNQLSNYTDLFEKNTNNFSFTHEFVNAINNTNVKRTVYNALSGNYNTKESYIWAALSNVAEKTITDSFLHDNISEIFEANILNFIDNISDVDVCKIKSLQSLINQLGINYTIFEKIQQLPLKILKLIDILSIKKEYLIKNEKLNPIFSEYLNKGISSLAQSTSIELNIETQNLTNARLSSIISTFDEDIYISSELSNNISVNYDTYIDNDKLNNFTSAVYAKTLSDYCYMQYNTTDTYIVNDMSDSIILSDFSIANTDYDEVNELDKYKTKYNIAKSFNEVIEFDKIENGYTKFSDYGVHEQYLLSAEQKYRNQALCANVPQSRYYYYRKKAVREYFKFIENEYSDYINVYNNTEQYNINNSYLVINKNDTNNLYKPNGIGGYEIDNTMIDHVAILLAQITESIRDIREQIKMQVQKNFLKGTKLHLAFIIREYIKNNIYLVYKQLCQQLKAQEHFDITPIEYQMSDVIININEYSDMTEYFNISTANDVLSDNTNKRYWETNDYINAIKGHNSTNLFSQNEIIKGSANKKLTFNDIYNFYNQTLQMPLNISTNISDNTYSYENSYKDVLNNFLCNVYNTGADNTYQDESGNICCNIDFNETSSISNFTDEQLIEFRNYKTSLYKKYSGLSTGSEPFFNIKNIKHPSYQIHPVIQNFTYSDEFDYPIDNIANIFADKLTSMLTKNLSNYVDDGGYLINVWNNPYNTNDDYITLYEKSTNRTDLDIIQANIDYDGIFYPKAVKEFLANNTIFESEVCANTNNWYKNLNLNENERTEIYNQLSIFYEEIEHIVNGISYNIYRYGRDYYGNMYILVKYDDSKSITNINSSILKDETYWKDKPGTLYMRFKNHPIAFPMMVYDYLSEDLYRDNTFSFDKTYVYNESYSQIKIINDKKHNIKSIQSFDEVAKHNNTSAKMYYPDIYDFSISKDKTQLLFITRNSDNKIAIHANIKKIFDNTLEKNKYSYYLTLDTYNSKVDKDSIMNLGDYDINGFYNYENYLGVIATKCGTITNNILPYTIYLPYWNKNDKNGEQEKTQLLYTVNCENAISDANTDIQIDVNDTKKLITIAYRNNKFNSKPMVQDKLGHNFNYPDIPGLSSYIDTIDTGITTKEFVYDSKQIIERTELKRDYAIYGDMGFIKVYNSSENCLYNTDINQNNGCWLSSIALKKQVKFELIGPNAGEKNDGIFFNFVVPARMHEKYTTIKFNNALSNGQNLSIGDYNQIRYTEAEENQYLKTLSEKIYDPMQLNNEVGLNDLSIRINEQFINTLSSISAVTNGEYSKATFDRFNDIPYILKDSKDISNYHELYDPGNNVNQHQAKLCNTYIIKIYKDEEDNYVDTLSVNWYKTNDEIKIDFNGAWYNYHTDKIKDFTDASIKNLYNIKHQFLNLDKPGACGYLWTQSLQLDANNNKVLVPKTIYFIKNVSDKTTPKFILQIAEDSVNEVLLSNIIDKYYPIADDDTGSSSSSYANNAIIVNMLNSKLFIENYVNK